jgi:hypothetical protein
VNFLEEFMVPDPWAFGWTQVFTLSGLIISVIVSIAGLRTFGKWKREKVEEKKLEIAFEALSLAYESQMVFEDIRRRFVREYEWAEMPTAGLSKEQQERRHSLYAIINRFSRHLGFFDRVLVLQPKIMAVFGKKSEESFQKLHRARNHIQAACDVLMEVADPLPGKDERELNLQMRSDIWDINSSGVKEPNRVTKLLDEFRAHIERICAPVVNREFRQDNET